MYANTHAAYRTTQREGETLRESEARALLSCASRLEAARRPDCPREEWDAAIRRNQKLWTIFQAALTDPNNALPEDLKILLLNISRYIDKTSTRALLDHGNVDLLRSLITLNRHIAVGLSMKKETEAAPAAMAPPPAPGERTPVATTA